MGRTRRPGSQRSRSDGWDARRSAQSFTASRSILISTKPVRRAVLFPPGREGTDTECVSVLPGDTQAWRGRKRLPRAGVRLGVRAQGPVSTGVRAKEDGEAPNPPQGPVSTGIRAKEDGEAPHPPEICARGPSCGLASSSVRWG